MGGWWCPRGTPLCRGAPAVRLYNANAANGAPPHIHLPRRSKMKWKIWLNSACLIFRPT